MKKLAFTLLLTSSLFGSWQMVTDSNGGAFLYDTELGTVLHCGKDKDIYLPNKTTKLDNYGCEQITFLKQINQNNKMLTLPTKKISEAID